MSIIDNIVDKLVSMVNKERKKKIEAIINVTDPKMRKIAKKYRDKIAKNTESLLQNQKNDNWINDKYTIHFVSFDRGILGSFSDYEQYQRMGF